MFLQAAGDNAKPVLYTAGESDPLIQPEVLQMIADGIGGEVRVEVFPDGPHQLMLFETEKFAALVHEFCTGIVGNN